MHDETKMLELTKTTLKCRVWVVVSLGWVGFGPTCPMWHNPYLAFKNSIWLLNLLDYSDMDNSKYN